MVPDWAANRVYVSDLLGHEYPEVHDGLRAIVKAAGIRLRTIHGTRDVWARDYCPIQVAEGSYIQFTYAPSYLAGYESSITPPYVCRLGHMTHYRKVELVLDGGNVVASQNRVILTDQIYRENPGRPKKKVRALLEEALQAEIIVIPHEPYDATGHADGMVRFLSEDAVVVNDYSRADPGFGKKLRRKLERKGLSVECLPYRPTRRIRRNEIGSAVGNYVNYLRVGDLIVLPAYGRREDEIARRRIHSLLPQAQVFSLPCRALAEEGGALNCVTYTTRQGSRYRLQPSAPQPAAATPISTRRFPRPQLR